MSKESALFRTAANFATRSSIRDNQPPSPFNNFPLLENFLPRIIYLRDSIKITFLLRSPNFRNLSIPHSDYFLVYTGRSLETTHALLRSASMVSTNPRGGMGKEKEKEKEREKRKKQSTQRNELSRRRREGWEERGSWRGDITICLVIRWKTSTTERRVGVFTSLTPAKKHRRQRK